MICTETAIGLANQFVRVSLLPRKNGQSFDWSSGRSVSQSRSQTLSQPVDRSISLSVAHQLASQSVRQSVG